MAYGRKNDSKRLSYSFLLKDFDCKNESCCNATYVDDGFVEMLQRLVYQLEADTGAAVKFDIIKGFVCENNRDESDGMHCFGNAADIVAFADGNIIDAKTVCAAAQTVGFNGIMLVDNNTVHIDTRLYVKCYYDNIKKLVRRDWLTSISERFPD